MKKHKRYILPFFFTLSSLLLHIIKNECHVKAVMSCDLQMWHRDGGRLLKKEKGEDNKRDKKKKCVKSNGQEEDEDTWERLILYVYPGSAADSADRRCGYFMRSIARAHLPKSS